MGGSAPISWIALNKGTTVVSSDGAEVGKVVRVIGEEAHDIFSGITVRQSLRDHERLVPADRVESMTENEVRLSMTSHQVSALGPYEG